MLSAPTANSSGAAVVAIPSELPPIDGSLTHGLSAIAGASAATGMVTKKVLPTPLGRRAARRALVQVDDAFGDEQTEAAAAAAERHANSQAVKTK